MLSTKEPRVQKCTTTGQKQLAKEALLSSYNELYIVANVSFIAEQKISFI